MDDEPADSCPFCDGPLMVESEDPLEQFCLDCDFCEYEAGDELVREGGRGRYT